MKIVRFVLGGERRYGILEGETLYALGGDVFADFQPGRELAKLGQVRILPPCEPSKVIAVGLNYRSHAQEMGVPIPEEPIIFLKPPSAVIGHLDEIIYPPSSQRVDYEAELGVVIKRRGKNIPSEKARSYILGYTCANDVTARDLQGRDGQWTRGKSFDTFCPLGPYVATDLEPSDLAISSRLNGQTRQASSTSDLIFGVETLVSFISQVMTLEPGDMILTGTPGGIGPMQPGDEVEVEIEGIGVLRNRLMAQPG